MNLKVVNWWIWTSKIERVLTIYQVDTEMELWNHMQIERAVYVYDKIFIYFYFQILLNHTKFGL